MRTASSAGCSTAVDVAQGHGVLDLQRGKRREGGIEALPEPLQRLQGLAHPFVTDGRRLQDVAWSFRGRR